MRGFPIQNGGLIVQYMAQPIFQIFLGLNPALFGLAMTIPRIWDAFTDPIMGRISDRTQSRYGRRRPYVFFGALAVALTFLTIWMVPQSMGDTGTFLWLTIGSVLFFTAFTVFRAFQRARLRTNARLSRTHASNVLFGALL